MSNWYASRLSSWRQNARRSKNTRTRRGARRWLRLEALEERQLLAAMPQLVTDLNRGAGGGSDPGELTEVGGIVYFTAETPTTGRELWKSDGTEAGTVRVKDIWPGTWPGTYGSGPNSLTNVNGTLYFVADDGTSGSELWKSDGTEGGTVRVKDIRPGSAPSDPFDLTNVNRTLYFSANDGASGRELWKSDGTEAGTVRAKDIRPGSDESYPRYLTNVNGTLYFVADGGTSGRELWKSDGTEAGTVRA